MSEVKLQTKRGPSAVSVQLDQALIEFDVEGWKEPFSEIDDFALWLGLPFAMRMGRNLFVDGPVSTEALNNARRLIEYWTCWSPEKFKPVDVRAAEVGDGPAPGSENKVMCFSGGVDSTYALAKHCDETDEKVWLLTVHGMEYRSNDKKRFQELLKKTSPVRKRFGLGNVVVRSNILSEFKKYKINNLHAFGFHLAGAQFLFDNAFSSGAIAADNPDYLEVVRMPYGSNSISNPLFRNHRFKLETWGLEAARSQKLGYLASDEALLRSLSFCKDQRVRPNNCGLCTECLRAKGIFQAEIGRIPEIFMINEFDVSDLKALVFQDNFQLAAMDIIWAARRTGRAHMFEAFEDFLHSNPKSRRLARLKYKISSKSKVRRQLLPLMQKGSD